MGEDQPDNSQQPRNPADHLVQYRWKPGSSPNPKGRPRSRFVTKAIQKELQAQVEEPLRKKLGLPEGTTNLEVAVKALVKAAQMGNVRAFHECRVAVEGRESHRVEGLRDFEDEEIQLTPLQEAIAKLDPVDRNLLIAAREKMLDIIRGEIDASKTIDVEAQPGAATGPAEAGIPATDGQNEPRGKEDSPGHGPGDDPQ